LDEDAYQPATPGGGEALGGSLNDVETSEGGGASAGEDGYVNFTYTVSDE